MFFACFSFLRVLRFLCVREACFVRVFCVFFAYVFRSYVKRIPEAYFAVCVANFSYDRASWLLKASPLLLVRSASMRRSHRDLFNAVACIHARRRDPTRFLPCDVVSLRRHDDGGNSLRATGARVPNNWAGLRHEKCGSVFVRDSMPRVARDADGCVPNLRASRWNVRRRHAAAGKPRRKAETASGRGGVHGCTRRH